MNLTDKEVNRFRAAVNSLLEELPKLVPHQDRNLLLNSRSFNDKCYCVAFKVEIV